MAEFRVAVIGGGPAGLTAAMLLKRAHPKWDVALHERHAAQDTFGYGVGLRLAALARLDAVAPGCVADIRTVAHELSRQTVTRDGVTASVTSAHGVGIARRDLLNVLGRHAAAVGVAVHARSTAGLGDLDDADLVVAADGVGSAVRTTLADDLGATTEEGSLRYLWCGARVPLDGMTLALTRTPSGPFAAHVMPYGDQTTFQVDAAAAVIDRWDPDHAGAPVSDGATIALLEKQYADLLGGARLHTTQPAWSPFTTVRCANWWTGNVVLLGDAVHTAHYTVGSGTGLAIDDAITLAEVLSDATVPEALPAYQAARKPQADRLQLRAERSERWWTTLDVRYDLPLPVLLLSYLSRTGALSYADLAEPIAAAGGAAATDVLPGRVYTADGDERVLTIEVDADSTAERISATLAGRDVSHVRLVGDHGREGVLDRLDAAELIRAATGLPTIVRGDAATVDDLALGLLCHRTDLVEIS